MSMERRWALVVGLEALIVVMMLPFGLVFTGNQGLHEFQMLVLGAAGVCGWIAVVWRPTALPANLVLAPFPLLATLVLSAAMSRFPSLSWSATWQTAAYAGIFWLLAMQASHPRGRPNLVAVIWLVVALTLASYLFSVLLGWIDWIGLGFPVTSLPVRPSNAGGLALLPTWLADLVALGTPVLVATSWRRGSRTAAGLLALVAVVAIVLTGTRSVLLLTAAASVVAVLIAIRGRAGRGILAAIISVVLVAGIVGAVVVVGSSRSFDEGRSSAYASAWARIGDQPLFGTGPGTFGVERMGDRVDLIGHLAFPDAHNIVLNTMAESGIVGLLGLLGTVALLVRAIRRSWRASDDKLIIAGCLFGIAIFAAHGMVDVVFGLIGIVAGAIGIVALAATKTTTDVSMSGARSLYLRAAAGIGLAMVVLITSAVFRIEGTFATVADADAALPSAPDDALTLARRATDAAPDLVPAWWVQMVAADAAGAPDTAVAAARRTIALEGFGQERISLAILASRQGDTATELDAIARATAGPPVDPLVELNVVMLLDAAGDRAGAEAAARRLLAVQPDIEPLARTGPSVIATAITAVHAEVAARLVAESNPGGAMLVALNAEDRALASAVIAYIMLLDKARGDGLRLVIDAWFGDAKARSTFLAAAVARPTLEASLWAWRLAGRTCDESAMSLWERAIEIGYGFHPTTPNKLSVAPADQTNGLPMLYPSFVWKLDHPQRPYVDGTWTFSSGRPICSPVVP